MFLRHGFYFIDFLRYEFNIFKQCRSIFFIRDIVLHRYGLVFNPILTSSRVLINRLRPLRIFILLPITRLSPFHSLYKTALSGLSGSLPDFYSHP